MKIDYSIFDTDEYDDLEPQEQIMLVMNTFEIGSIINIYYDERNLNIKTNEWYDNEESKKYSVVGYKSISSPGGFNRITNVYVVPVKLYDVFGMSDSNCKSYHPSLVRHNKEWLRENKIDEILG